MNKLRPLFLLELRSLFGLNKARYTRDPKAKRNCRLLSVAWAVLIGMILLYAGGLSYGLCLLGMGEILPAYLAVLASILVLAVGFFTAGSRIFGQKGYDLLCAMPLRPSGIVLSRFLCLYLEDLLLALLILLPGIGVYSVCCQPGWRFYVLAVLGAVLLPAIPLVVSVLIGTGIMAVSARMKRKSLVQSLLAVLVVVAVLVGSFRVGDGAQALNPEILAQMAQSLYGILEKRYPPAIWLAEGMVRSDGRSFALFAGLSLGLIVLAVFLTAKGFHSILRRLGTVNAKHAYKIGTLESRSLLKALWLREVKRYFSSSIYVTNTIIGPIMGTVLAVALCVTGLDPIEKALPVKVDIPGLLPFVFGAVFCMMTTTCTSISMEGKQFWVVKSLPIPTKTLLDSKLLLNLSLMLPFYAVSVGAMAIGIRADLMQLCWLILIPASGILFSVVWGISVNLKLYSFDWEKEETVVKQSAAAALGGFAGLLLNLMLGGAVLLTPEPYADGVKLLLCLLLLAGTGLLYRKNNTVDLRNL